MCYAIPGKVIGFQGKYVLVDYYGETKKAINEVKGLQIGDYIYAQGGFVISKISEQEAKEILDIWKEMFFSLQKTDLRLSRLDLNDISVDKAFTRILDKALEGIPLQKPELLRLLETKNQKELSFLFRTANYLRQKHLKNSCCVHGIIEFSNYCENDCSYCGIRKSNTKIKRYRMTTEEIMAAVDTAVNEYGFKALVLQAGEDPYYTPDILEKLILDIKAKYQVLLFISIGEVGKENLLRFYKAGARGLLLRFETSNPQIYANCHPNDKLEDRLQELKHAYEIGYLVLTGGLVGLPGQTNEDLLNDILLTKELHADMYSFGPVIPSGVRSETVLKVLAISRIVDPVNAKILVTTGFETLDPDARKLGLLAGANSVMLNVTPQKYRELYSIYPDRAHGSESIPEQIETTLALLKDLGRAPTDLGI